MRSCGSPLPARAGVAAITPEGSTYLTATIHMPINISVDHQHFKSKISTSFPEFVGHSPEGVPKFLDGLLSAH